MVDLPRSAGRDPLHGSGSWIGGAGAVVQQDAQPEAIEGAEGGASQVVS